jgi:hypothetical protein
VVITRSEPSSGLDNVTTVHMRGMLLTLGSAGQGSR